MAAIRFMEVLRLWGPVVCGGWWGGAVAARAVCTVQLQHGMQERRKEWCVARSIS
jgi:hypothetical protein